MGLREREAREGKGEKETEKGGYETGRRKEEEREKIGRGKMKEEEACLENRYVAQMRQNVNRKTYNCICKLPIPSL